jgi:hypothetical protein
MNLQKYASIPKEAMHMTALPFFGFLLFNDARRATFDTKLQ